MARCSSSRLCRSATALGVMSMSLDEAGPADCKARSLQGPAMAGLLRGKPNLLVVDDKRANQLALDALLAEEYQLFFASSGPEAISLLAKESDIDVILLDVQMPGMDGFQTAAAIKAIEA